MDNIPEILKVACVGAAGMNFGMQGWFVGIHAPALRNNVEYKILSQVQGILFPRLFVTSAVFSTASLAGYYFLTRERGCSSQQLAALTFNFAASVTNVALTGRIMRHLRERDALEEKLAPNEPHKEARLRLIQSDKAYAAIDRGFYRVHGVQTGLAMLAMVALGWHLVHLARKVEL